MALTQDQLVIFQTDILNNPNQVVIDAISSGADNIISSWYNGIASPNFFVWKDNISLVDVGTNLNGQNLADITSANSERLQSFFITNPGGVFPARADHRAFFDDVFSGAPGAETLVNLNALWSNLATEAQKLFADTSGGDGGTSTTAAIIIVNNVTSSDVAKALRG